MDENGWKWPTMDEMDGVGWNGCKWIGSGVQSIEHSNVLREKINFFAHGSANWSIFFFNRLCSGVQSIEHPNVLREKINFTAHGSANWSIFFCGTLTQYIFRFDKFFAPPTPPTWWYVTKRVKFCHFGESQIKGTPQIGVYPEKFNIGFLAQIFFGSSYTCMEARKKIWAKKSMLNFSR